MNNEIGTLAWGKITRGSLKGGDRMRQLLDALGMRIMNLMPRSAPRRFDLDDIIIPDSLPARRAAEACREAASPALANHSLRAYLWGELIALREERAHDPELFFIAAMMHDIALTKQHEFCNPDAHCFALEGADLMLREGPGWGLDQARTRRAAEAIALHLNISVSPGRHGNEAYLLHEGTALDVAGVGMTRIHEANRHEVLRRYPRGRLTRELTRSLGRQVRERPACRMNFLFEHGFGDMIAGAPFGQEKVRV